MNTICLTLTDHSSFHMCKVEKSKLPLCKKRMRKAMIINPVPMCVMMTYNIPEFRTSCRSCSKMTRKKETSDIISHITKNVKPLCARTTPTIESKNKLNPAPSKATFFNPSYLCTYFGAYIETTSEIIVMIKRKKADKTSKENSKVRFGITDQSCI